MSERLVYVRAGSRIYGGYVRNRYVDPNDGILNDVVIELRVTRSRVITGSPYVVAVGDNMLYDSLNDASAAVNEYHREYVWDATGWMIKFGIMLLSL